jgi:predicted nucleic acid-binding protein
VTFVLDTSVLLKWFLDEPGSAAASDLKTRYLAGEAAIAIPDLALYEIPNVLRFKRGVPQSELTAVMQAFRQLGLEVVAPTEPLLEDAVRLSYLIGLWSPTAGGHGTDDHAPRGATSRPPVRLSKPEGPPAGGRGPMAGSLYDCAYLALARQLEAGLFTADVRLHRAASGLVQATLLR